MPVAMPPVSAIANHVANEYFGLASLPPILILPIFEKVTTATSTKQAMIEI